MKSISTIGESPSYQIPIFIIFYEIQQIWHSQIPKIPISLWNPMGTSPGPQASHRPCRPAPAALPASRFTPCVCRPPRSRSFSSKTAARSLEPSMPGPLCPLAPWEIANKNGGCHGDCHVMGFFWYNPENLTNHAYLILFDWGLVGTQPYLGKYFTGRPFNNKTKRWYRTHLESVCLCVPTRFQLYTSTRILCM